MANENRRSLEKLVDLLDSVSPIRGQTPPFLSPVREHAPKTPRSAMKTPRQQQAATLGEVWNRVASAEAALQASQANLRFVASQASAAKLRVKSMASELQAARSILTEQFPKVEELQDALRQALNAREAAEERAEELEQRVAASTIEVAGAQEREAELVSKLGELEALLDGELEGAQNREAEAAAKIKLLEAALQSAEGTAASLRQALDDRDTEQRLTEAGFRPFPAKTPCAVLRSSSQTATRSSLALASMSQDEFEFESPEPAGTITTTMLWSPEDADGGLAPPAISLSPIKGRSNSLPPVAESTTPPAATWGVVGSPISGRLVKLQEPRASAAGAGRLLRNGSIGSSSSASSQRRASWASRSVGALSFPPFDAGFRFPQPPQQPAESAGAYTTPESASEASSVDPTPAPARRARFGATYASMDLTALLAAGQGSGGPKDALISRGRMDMSNLALVPPCSHPVVPTGTPTADSPASALTSASYVPSPGVTPEATPQDSQENRPPSDATPSSKFASFPPLALQECVPSESPALPVSARFQPSGWGSNCGADSRNEGLRLALKDFNSGNNSLRSNLSSMR